MDVNFRKPDRQKKLMLNLLDEKQLPSIYLVSTSDSFIENPLNKTATYNYNPLRWQTNNSKHECCQIL